MPFVYMIAAVGVVQFTIWCASLFRALGARGSRLSATATALIIFVALPAGTAYASAPHYAAYTNALGGGRVGYYFPHDEFYDDGLREAIRFVCEVAPQGALIVHETPGAVRYYLEQYGRADLQSRVLSAADFHLEDELTRPAYIIVQRGRTYFENQDKITQVRAQLPKVYEVKVEGASAAEVYATQQSR